MNKRIQQIVTLQVGLVVVVVAALTLAGCGGGTVSQEPAPTGGSTLASQESGASIPIMGTPVAIGDVTLSAERFARSVGDQVSRAKRGRTWAMVTVAVVNQGSGPVDVNPADFTVTTSSGEIATADPNVHFLPMLKSTSLAAGKSVEGRVGFDVPEKDDLVMKWTPAWAADKSVSIKLVKQ